MNDKLKEQWLELEAAKSEFLSIIEAWDESNLRQSPNEGWNALQVMNHIMISEFGTLGYLQKKTSGDAADIPVAGEGSFESASKLNEALKSDRKWAAPAVLPDPSDEDDFHVAVAKWSKLRQKLGMFLENLDSAYHDKEIFRHPFAGRINLEQTMQFLTNHIVHHKHQLHRIKAELS